MSLSGLDLGIVLGFLAISLLVGVITTRRASRSASEYFLSGRTMPWWLLGVSMVATTFSADTPNLVTDIVRRNGVAGNWVWWAFLLTGMLTCFFFARLWRRSGVSTDVEFYELRYSGRSAAFLRGFRAVYLGVLFNVLVMASVTLAAIKIGAVLLGVSPLTTVLVAGTVTLAYSMLGGLTGVLITDFLQFGVALAGAVAAAWVVVGHPSVGGLHALLTHEAVRDKLSLLPSFDDPEAFVAVLIIPLTVQWWSVWYPGAEPGGGGYLAQRMLAAKNEVHAQGATLLFNVAHYAIRPWPWILVALASLVVFPATGADGLDALRARFPGVKAMGHDLAYPAMLTLLPTGLMGVVVASLVAAYMSTISTHLNWGASYVVNDVYRRFVAPDASEHRLVLVGRLATAGMMAAACAIALTLQTALQAFHILLMVGAGTGLIFIVRWFWWRINPAAEITAMVVSFVVAITLEVLDTGLRSWQQLLIGVGCTTVAWVSVTFLTAPSSTETLRNFVRTVAPGGPGWASVFAAAAREGAPIEPPAGQVNLPTAVLLMMLGCVAVYGGLFATGYFIYGQMGLGAGLTAAATAAAAGILRLWGRLVR